MNDRLVLILMLVIFQLARIESDLLLDEISFAKINDFKQETRRWKPKISRLSGLKKNRFQKENPAFVRKYGKSFAF